MLGKLSMLWSWWDFVDEKERGHLWLITGSENQLRAFVQDVFEAYQMLK